MRVRLATKADDDILRKTLRDNPMSSWVTMSIEREPVFFNQESLLQHEKAVLVEDTDRNLVGMYTCTPHQLWIDGQETDISYLSGFRVNQAYRGKLKYIKAGYASISSLTPSQDGYWYTCIANENKSARRLLEAGIDGLPVYKNIGDIVTIAIPKSRGQKRGLWLPVHESEVARVCEMYNVQRTNSALAHRLTEEIVRRNINSFYVCRKGDLIKACIALFDQRSYKQCVAKAYKFPLNILLPLYNSCARILKKIRLPRIGESLQQVFIAYFACQDDAIDYLQLLEDAVSLAPVDVCTMTFDMKDDRLYSIRKRFSPAEYAAKIYLVGYGGLPNIGSGSIHLNGGLL